MSNQLLIRRRTTSISREQQPDYFRITPVRACTLTIGMIACDSDYGDAYYDGLYIGDAELEEYYIETYLDWNIEYSINGGVFRKATLFDRISLQDGDYVEFRYNPSEGVRFTLEKQSDHSFYWHGEYYNLNFGDLCVPCLRPNVPYVASGNIMSLLDATCQSSTIGHYAFASFFRDDEYLIGYNYTLNFSDIIGEQPLRDMFRHMSSTNILTQVPKIVTPQQVSINRLFGYSTFYGCNHVEHYDLSTIDSSPYLFYNNASAKSLIIRNAIPPTIGSSTITGLAADCIIYVPAGSVDAYKAAQYWSARADYIFELDENGNIPQS